MANERRSGFGFWDRLILFTAWVVTCGLVYLLGFYVGKGTQAERLGLEERIVRLPVTSSPPREGQRPKTDGELTFYDKLVARQGGERRPEPPSRRTAGRPRRRSPPRLPRMRLPPSPCCPDPYP